MKMKECDYTCAVGRVGEHDWGSADRMEGTSVDILSL